MERQPVRLMGVFTATASPSVFTNNTQSGTTQVPMTLSRTGTGAFTLTLADSYASLISASIMIQKAIATDMIVQIASSDVTTAQTVTFRTQSGAVPTDLVAGDKIIVCLDLRNSGN